MRERGREIALWQVDGTPDWSFGELAREAEKMAAWLTKQPGGQELSGRVVALGWEHGPEWLTALLALWKCGAVVLLSGPTGPEPGPSVGAALRACGALAVLHSGADGAPRWLKLEHAPIPLPAHTVLLKMTSGTTATPKLLAFTTAQLAADLQQILADMGLQPTDRNFGLLPWSHSYGFSNLVSPVRQDKPNRSNIMKR